MRNEEIIERLSSPQGRRDQTPNKELANELFTAKDHKAIAELVKLLSNSAITIDQLGDILKVLEMIGEQSPELISGAFSPALQLLNSPHNKLVWRAMIIVGQTSRHFPDQTYASLGRILEIMDKGSVITRDHGINVLIHLYQGEYSTQVKPLLLEQVLIAPDNQLGQYAEKWINVIEKKDIADLVLALEQRQPDLTHPAHQKRISKNILKIRKLMK